MQTRSAIPLSLLLILLPSCADEFGADELDSADCDPTVEACDGTPVSDDEVEESEDDRGAASRPDDEEPWTDPEAELASSDPMEGGAFREVWFADGRVPYYVDAAFSTGETATIDAAMNFLEDHTPIDVTKFPSAGSSRRLRFRAVTGGCGMAYGYWDENRSNPAIRLGASCRTARTVHHEMFHGLGFAHEFQRPDRNDHVSVCFNSDPFNYGKLGSAFWPDEHAMLSPFDFESVTNAGYTGAGGCISSTVGTFDFPRWKGIAQPLSRHDINSLYRMYAKPLSSAEEEATFGNALAAGDFDDDGIEDLVVADLDPMPTSAIINLSFFKGVELDESEGKAGRLFEPWFKHKLSFTPDRNVQLSAAAGDFDGDGIPEVAIGDPSFNNGAGQVHVVTVNDGTGSVAPWGLTGIVGINRITAADAGLQSGRAHGFGASLTTGKLTALDHDDLVIGAPNASSGSTSGSFVVLKQAGGAVVHLPGADETASEVTWNPDYSAVSVLGGGGSGSSNDFGMSLTTLPYYCDHNPNVGNDQFDTFVAGAPGYNADAGAIYVFGCSRTSGGTPIEPALRRRVTHSQPQARYGKSIAGFRAMSQIASGEMEFYLAIGTPGYESGGVKTGRVYLDKFSPTGSKTYVASYSPDVAVGDDKLGLSIAVFQGGDLGILDRRFVHLAIGMPRTDNSSGVQSGRVHVWRPFVGSGGNDIVWSPSSATSGMRFGKRIIAVHSDSPSGGFAMSAPEAVVDGHSGAGRVTVRLDQVPTTTGWTSARQELDTTTGPDKPTLN